MFHPGQPNPSQVLSSGFSPPGPVAPFFNPQGQEEVANSGHPRQGPHLAPARTHIARMEGPVVQLHLLHGGPGAQATYREGPQDRGLTVGMGSRQVLRADTSRSRLTSRSLGKRLTPRDCSEGLTAPRPLPVDWHRAPSSCSPPRCTVGQGAQSQVPKDSWPTHQGRWQPGHRLLPASGLSSCGATAAPVPRASPALGSAPWLTV